LIWIITQIHIFK